MDELFSRLGLNDGETRVYKLLLSEQALTASQIASKTKETRTNAYSILESLVDTGLVSEDESQAVRRYIAKHPSELVNLVENKRSHLDQTKQLVESALPDLNSMYNLAHHKPGVFHGEGIEGYKKLLDDMAKSSSDIWLLPTQLSDEERQSSDILNRGIAKRRAKGVKTKAILPECGKEWDLVKLAAAKNFDIRFWGEPVDAEIIQYDDKVAFTVYEPQLINTIITDLVLAKTLDTVFRKIWEDAGRFFK